MLMLLDKILPISTARGQLDACNCAFAAYMQPLPSIVRKGAIQPLEPKVWHGHKKVQFSQAHEQGVRRLRNE